MKEKIRQFFVSAKQVLDSKLGKFAVWFILEAGGIVVSAYVAYFKFLVWAFAGLAILLLGMRFALDYPAEAAVVFTPAGSSIPFLNEVMVPTISTMLGILIGCIMVQALTEFTIEFLGGPEDRSLMSRVAAKARDLADWVTGPLDRKLNPPAPPLTVHNNPE